MDANQPQISTLVAIRAAHHAEATPKYDRVVFEFNGPVPMIQVEYVTQLLGDGSGLPVAIAGQAIIHVRLAPAQGHNNAGQMTAPGRIKANLPNVKEIVGAGDFEGVVSYGIGVNHKSETRVITMAGPSRVVVDVIV